MEGLGWWIYLCSVAGGILTVSLIFSIVFLAAFLITSVAYYNDDSQEMAEIYWHHWDNFRSVCYLGSFKIYLLPNFWSYSCNRSN